jgi:NTP pyrophosphatase (non-canonical NTP hydrolase)
MNADIQSQVAEFVKHHKLNTDVTHRMLDLVSEVGELSKELLKATNYGKRKFYPSEINSNWQEEIGDVLFSLICIANATNVDLEQSLTQVLEKYRKRIQSKHNAGSGR